MKYLFKYLILIIPILIFKVETAKSQSRINPIFSIEEAKKMYKIDSLYKLEKYDKVINEYPTIDTMKSILKEYATVYLYGYLSYLELNDKEKAFGLLSKMLNRGYKINNIDLVLETFSYDSTREKFIADKISFNNKSEIDSSLIKYLDSLNEISNRWRSLPISYFDSLKIADEKIYTNFLKKTRQSDKENTLLVKGILYKYGWPGYDKLGDDGDGTLWVLVQHSDNDVAFQKFILQLLEASVLMSNTNPQNYGYLYDRICVNIGIPQLYGTQFNDVTVKDSPENSDIEVYPLYDEKNVDYYRFSVGLPPLDFYLNYAKQHFYDKEHK